MPCQPLGRISVQGMSVVVDLPAPVRAEEGQKSHSTSSVEVDTP